MDPDANLNEQLNIANRIIKINEKLHLDNEAVRLAELVVSLDEWLHRDGFLPARWRRMPDKKKG